MGELFIRAIHPIQGFVDSWSWMINSLSLIISGATLITMLRFKKRIRSEFDRRNLNSSLSKLLKELQGYSGSLEDGLYTKEFLEKIDLKLHEILVSYSCLSLLFRLRIHSVIWMLNHRCIKEAVSEQTYFSHKLCRQLTSLSILLRKEAS